MTFKLRAGGLRVVVAQYDVLIVGLPGSRNGRSVSDIRALASTAPPSRVAKLLFAVRRFLGRTFRWDESPIRAEDSLVSRLSASDRQQSEVVPGTPDGAFRMLYQFQNESLSEIRNRTVQGYVCVALRRTA